jgi:hypothetical protein
MYPVTLLKDKVYTFTTLQGVKYFCRFVDCTNQISPLLGVYDVKILEVDFYPDYYSKTEKRKIFDEEIEALSPNVILVSICDNSDMPGILRKKLFNRWRSKYAKDVETKEVDFYSETMQDNVYVLVHVRNNFLYPEILQNEINVQAIGIISQKFDG